MLRVEQSTGDLDLSLIGDYNRLDPVSQFCFYGCQEFICDFFLQIYFVLHSPHILRTATAI